MHDEMPDNLKRAMSCEAPTMEERAITGKIPNNEERATRGDYNHTSGASQINRDARGE